MPRRNFPIALLALAAAVAGCKEKPAPSDAASPVSAAEAGGAVAAKPEVKLPGVDSNTLTQRERTEWSKWVSEMMSPCAEVAVPIAQCVTEHRACDKCVPAAQYLLKLMRGGKTRAEAELYMKGRFTPNNIAVDGSPTQGPDGAPVTIVEFADFQCPHCANEVPVIDSILEKFKDKVQLVYKFVALEMHSHAESAARAALAAKNQGKFWEMHHRLFEVTRAFAARGQAPPFEQSDLEGYARDLHLDMAKFIEDMKSPSTSKRIETDKLLFDKTMDRPELAKLNRAGTPTVYINGIYHDFAEDPDLLVRVHEVLNEVTDGGAPPLALDAGAHTNAKGP